MQDWTPTQVLLLEMPSTCEKPATWGHTRKDMRTVSIAYRCVKYLSQYSLRATVTTHLHYFKVHFSSPVADTWSINFAVVQHNLTAIHILNVMMSSYMDEL